MWRWRACVQVRALAKRERERGKEKLKHNNKKNSNKKKKKKRKQKKKQVIRRTRGRRRGTVRLPGGVRGLVIACGSNTQTSSCGWNESPTSRPVESTRSTSSDTHDDYLFMYWWANLFSLPDGRLQLRLDPTILREGGGPPVRSCPSLWTAINVPSTPPSGNVLLTYLLMIIYLFFLYLICFSLSLSLSVCVVVFISLYILLFFYRVWTAPTNFLPTKTAHLLFKKKKLRKRWMLQSFRGWYDH